MHYKGLGLPTSRNSTRSCDRIERMIPVSFEGLQIVRNSLREGRPADREELELALREAGIAEREGIIVNLFGIIPILFEKIHEMDILTIVSIMGAVVSIFSFGQALRNGKSLYAIALSAIVGSEKLARCCAPP